MSYAKGFILWDIGLSLLIITLVSFFAITWYMHVSSAQVYAIRRVQAINLACACAERAYGTQRITVGEQIQDCFKIYIKHGGRYDNSINWYTVRVVWQEKDRVNQVALVVALP